MRFRSSKFGDRTLDAFDKVADVFFGVYAVLTFLSPLAIAWVFIFEPIFDTPKFAPGRPVTPSEGKTIPGDPEAPLQTPCKTQIDPKN